MTGTNSALVGAALNSGGTQSVAVTVVGHAVPVLGVIGGNNQSVIIGAAGITAALSLTDNGTSLSPLDVNTLSSGLTGATGTAVIASGSSGSYTATLSTSMAGLSQSQSFSLKAGDEQALPGASALGTLTRSVTGLNVYDHSNASLAPTATQTTQTIDFGNVLRGATVPGQSFTIWNLAAHTSAADTANLKLTGFTPDPNGDSALSTNLTTFNGLQAGLGNTFTASLNTANDTTTGSNVITLSASQLADDSTLPGAGGNNNGAITIALKGDVGSATADNSDSRSAFGTPLTATVNQGASYAGLASTVTSTTGSGGQGMQGGSATILAGTATVPATVSMAWRTAAAAPGGGNEGFASDVLDLSGMPAIDNETRDGSTHVGTFVLAVSYNPASITVRTGLSELAAAQAGLIQMDYLDFGLDDVPGTSDDLWLPAVDGNFGSTNDTFMGVEPWNGDMTLGDWGVNTSNHTVWAVLDHNSDFAVTPEPSALALLAAGAIGLVGYRSWRRRITRTAEPATFDQPAAPAILSFPSPSSQANMARRAA